MEDLKEFIKSRLTVADRGANLIEYKEGGYEVYISFKLLLEFISENLNLVTNNDTDIVTIDYQSDKPFYALSHHISTDLTVCYLYNDKLKIEDGNNGNGIPTFHPFTHFSDTDDGQLLQVVNANLRNESGATSEDFIYPQVGNINFIYLNIGHLSEILSKNLDKDNKITLRKFLQTICDDLNRALGGINDFQVVIDADSGNTLTIVDFYQSRIKGLVNAIGGNPQFATIQAQGTGIDNGNKATFVRKIQAQSNITPDMASAISIGAQANGNQLGVEATQFSRLSKGLIDRIYPEKYIKNTDVDGDKKVLIKDKFSTNIESFKQLIANLQNQSGQGSQINITISDENNNGPIVADLFKAIVGEFTNKNISNPTFIPIKLELEVLGISGIRIFEQFQLSSDILPLSYQNDFNFIVTGVSHDITTHKWITKISAYTYLKELPVSPSAEIKAIDLNLNPPKPQKQSTPGKFYKGATEATVDETVSFLTDVLKGLGISNPNNNQISFMKMWTQHENSRSAWNPLNTTQKFPGSLPFNSDNVQNYPTREIGLRATIKTLNNGLYGNVIYSIKSIKPGNDNASKNTINKVMETINKSKWGSKFDPVDWKKWSTLNNLLKKDPIIPR